MAIAYFQPITRGELSQLLGREVSRDAIAALRADGLVGRWVECHLPAGTVGRIDGRKRGFRNRTDRGLERSAPASNEANTPSGARRLWPNAGTGSDALGPNHPGSAFKTVSRLSGRTFRM